MTSVVGGTLGVAVGGTLGVAVGGTLGVAGTMRHELVCDRHREDLQCNSFTSS